MSTESLLSTLSSAIPRIKWRNATHPPANSVGPVAAADVTSCLTLVGWEKDGEFVVLALNHRDEIIGSSVEGDARSAIKHAALDGCIWLSEQTATMMEMLSEGADPGLLNTLAG